MSPLVYALLAMLTIGALGFAFVPTLFEGNRADKRRKALQGNYQLNREQEENRRQREMRRKSVQQALKAQTDQLEKHKKRPPLQTQIYQAGMKTKKSVFIRNSVILGSVVLVVLFLLEVPLLFAMIFAVAAAYLLPKWYLGRRRRKYQSKFLDELPNAVEAIVRGVKAGMPLNDSIRIVAKEVKEPVRSEFVRVVEQQSVGKSMAEAIEVLFDRVPLPEVNFLIVVINVQQQAGGNLSEALTNLARVLRNRKKMQSKVKAMSSEAKASAMIIGALPFVVGALVGLVSPGYFEPFYTTTMGMIWIGVAAILMGMGVFVMNRMIQFDF